MKGPALSTSIAVQAGRARQDSYRKQQRMSREKATWQKKNPPPPPPPLSRPQDTSSRGNRQWRRSRALQQSPRTHPGRVGVGAGLGSPPRGLSGMHKTKKKAETRAYKARSSFRGERADSTLSASFHFEPRRRAAITGTPDTSGLDLTPARHSIPVNFQGAVELDLLGAPLLLQS